MSTSPCALPTPLPARDTTQRLRGIGVPSEPAARDPAGDSGRAARGDSARRIAGGGPEPHFIILRETEEGRLVIGLAAASRSLDSGQSLALDSAVSVLKQHPELRAYIRYVDPSNRQESDSYLLAAQAREYVEFAGIAPERLRLSRVLVVNKRGFPPRLEAVEVVLTRPQDV